MADGFIDDFLYKISTQLISKDLYQWMIREPFDIIDIGFFSSRFCHAYFYFELVSSKLRVIIFINPELINSVKIEEMATGIIKDCNFEKFTNKESI